MFMLFFLTIMSATCCLMPLSLACYSSIAAGLLSNRHFFKSHCYHHDTKIDLIFLNFPPIHLLIPHAGHTRLPEIVHSWVHIVGNVIIIASSRVALSTQLPQCLVCSRNGCRCISLITIIVWCTQHMEFMCTWDHMWFRWWWLYLVTKLFSCCETKISSMFWWIRSKVKAWGLSLVINKRL